jgi:hypothetical protein
MYASSGITSGTIKWTAPELLESDASDSVSEESNSEESDPADSQIADYDAVNYDSKYLDPGSLNLKQDKRRCSKASDIYAFAAVVVNVIRAFFLNRFLLLIATYRLSIGK